MKRVLFLVLAFTACSPTIGEGDDDVGGDESIVGDSNTDHDDPNMLAVSPEVAKPKFEAFFAVPKADGTGDATLENKIIELIDGTPKGSRIRMSMYGFTRLKPANALVAAAKRGVDVQIVLDQEENFAAARALRVDATEVDEDVDSLATPDDAADETPVSIEAKAKSLNAAVEVLKHGLPSGSITFCTRGNGSCQGKGIDHNKIYMFSTTGGAHKVVVQSTANLTTHKLHNALVIARENPDLYDGYVSYFNDLKKKKLDLNYYRSVHGDKTIGYFFPRNDGGDTIVSVLKNVRCTSASHIRIAMAFWERTAVANELVTLQKKGCDVRVNMRHAGKDVSQGIINTLKNGGVNVALYPDQHGANIHSKYLVIDSNYTTSESSGHRHLVFTGSHNYTYGALENNDEALLRVDQEDVFQAYMDNWKTMRAQM
ncbi:MAG: phospholipase D-like domain-containing protein [Kofleriaceae bacterium]